VIRPKLSSVLIQSWSVLISALHCRGLIWNFCEETLPYFPTIIVALPEKGSIPIANVHVADENLEETPFHFMYLHSYVYLQINISVSYCREIFFSCVICVFLLNHWVGALAWDSVIVTRPGNWREQWTSGHAAIRILKSLWQTHLAWFDSNQSALQVPDGFAVFELACFSTECFIHCYNAQPSIFAVELRWRSTECVLIPCFNTLLDIFAVMNCSVFTLSAV